MLEHPRWPNLLGKTKAATKCTVHDSPIRVLPANVMSNSPEIHIHWRAVMSENESARGSETAPPRKVKMFAKIIQNPTTVFAKSSMAPESRSEATTAALGPTRIVEIGTTASPIVR